MITPIEKWDIDPIIYDNTDIKCYKNLTFKILNFGYANYTSHINLSCYVVNNYEALISCVSTTKLGFNPITIENALNIHITKLKHPK